MTVETHSPRPHPGVSDDLRLSCPESFRFFSEGVQALMAYERSAAKNFLETANERLTLCANKYPDDVLPRFYLGITKSFLGDMEQEEAISCFRSVESSRNDSLRLAAKYNLATTFIELYKPESMQDAAQLLDEVINELNEIKELKEATPWQKVLRFVGLRQLSQVDELLFQARAVLLYSKIHRDLWNHRQPDNLENLKSTIDKLQKELDRFWDEFNQAGGEKISGSDAILAEYWNERAIFEESLAGLYSVTAPKKSKQHAANAVKGFEEALRVKHNWPAAKANLARVCWEQLGQLDKAVALFKELTHGVEDVEYANYNLGKIYGMNEEYERAAEYYAKAPTIFSAQKGHAQTLQALHRPDEAREVWERILERRPDDEEALDALAKLQKPTPPTTNESTHS